MKQEEAPKPRRWRRIAGWVLRLAIPLLVSVFPSRWIPRDPALGMVFLVIVVALLALVTIDTVRAIRRSRREAQAIREARAAGRWPVGMRYVVEADYALTGSRRPSELTISESEIRLATLETDAPIAFVADEKRVISTADVVAVRVRSTWIEIATADQRVRVVPRSYEDRQRLLWELAVRCNAAVERGIDEAAAEAREKAPHPTATKFEDGVDPTGLDRAATGLGSALAGPMAPRNPAPPRKSGLGVGLFPAPPES